MPIYTQHTATRTLAIETQFECGSCGFASPCIVKGKGSGTARSSGWGRNDAAADLASEFAGEQAQRDARYVVKLAPCPRCGRRNAAEVAGLVRRSLVTFVVLGALGRAGAAWALESRGGLACIVVGLVVALLLLMLPVVVFEAVRAYVVAPRRVEFGT